MHRISLFEAGLGVTLALGLAMVSACQRDEEPLLCGDLGAGDLVITEVRGGPSIVDNDGQWIELYNASGGSVDLEGLALTVDSVGGSQHDRVLVRRSQTVAANGYVVIGKFADGTQPSHVDVGWGTTPSIPTDGKLTLSCADEIDHLVYTGLPDPSQGMDHGPGDPAPPGKGTYALGLVPPTATGNDDATNWCTDASKTLGPCDGQSNCLEYYKGSPGEPNPACTP
ncbi:MAG TPA: lamin tail domain-containing protein [Kofleriaceae bacterium]|nr:lamin tail domain-containing protein [Kofleriaceae bacterium]